MRLGLLWPESLSHEDDLVLWPHQSERMPQIRNDFALTTHQ